MSKLKILLNKKIKAVEFNLSSTSGINNIDEDLVELYLLIDFGDYFLSIFNNFSLAKNKEKNVKQLVGDILLKVEENNDFIDFTFQSGEILKINMTEEGYIGPEAMCLLGKDGLNVVWN